MPQQTKIFRVFVSSTFTDMREERRILQQEVFPKLEKLCESKGARFQAVDLRWGVNEASQLDHKTIDICLGEVKRCQRLSPKPNFIGLLGDRYGWQPVPAKIPACEMAEIENMLSPDEKIVIRRWYLKDDNAIPAEYVLQSRGREHRSYRDWEEVETRIRVILRGAVEKLNFSQEQKVRYFASATHMEIIQGALNPSETKVQPEDHVFIYSRNIKNLPGDKSANDYIDISRGFRDINCQQRISALKNELKIKLKDHYYEYDADWNDSGPVCEDVKAFTQKVYNDLEGIIKSQLSEIIATDDLENEMRIHGEFRDRLTEHFCGRADIIDKIINYLKDLSESRTLFISGYSGTGKSSVIARAVYEAGKIYKLITFRFLGISSQSSDLRSLLLSLCREIAGNYGVSAESLAGEGNEKALYEIRGLTEVFKKCLLLATMQQPAILFLDALDQLNNPGNEKLIQWLPVELPENIRIIVSATPDMENHLSGAEKLQLSVLEDSEAEQIVKKWFQAAGRKLSEPQLRGLLSGFRKTGLAIYLKLAFERAKHWHSYDTKHALQSDVKGIINDFFQYLEKEHTPELVKKVISYILCGKGNGLAETEIHEILFFDTDFKNSFLKNSHKYHRKEIENSIRIPIVVWSRLYLDLESFLTERDADGMPVISFFHRSFIGILQKRYGLDNNKVEIKYQDTLGSYFKKKALGDDPGWTGTSRRGFSEVIYHLNKAGRWDEAKALLTDFAFLIEKSKKGLTGSIAEDYKMVISTAPKEFTSSLEKWESFFRERIHILRRGNEEWPSHKILLQLAIEHADDSPVTLGAENWLASGNCNWLWLRRNVRLAHVNEDPCLAVFEGHLHSIAGAFETSDGNIISWSQDNTIRLWNKKGELLTSFIGHTSDIKGVMETRNRNILSWSFDKTFILWDREGNLIRAITGHTDAVKDVIETREGNILSFAINKEMNLILWRNDGYPLAGLHTHSTVGGVLERRGGGFIFWSDQWDDDIIRLWDPVTNIVKRLDAHKGAYGAIESREGNIISWSLTGTIWFRDKTGNNIALVEAHKGIIGGLIETRDGSFLSWSWDKTMKLWDINGAMLSLFEGHTEKINGVIETFDGNFLSYSEDCMLILWDKSGNLIAQYPGHKSGVCGVIETVDQNFISWSRSDIDNNSNLLFWNRNEKTCIRLVGHSRHPNGILQTHEGNFLSWSFDFTLRLWDKNIKSIDQLPGHSVGVRDSIKTSHGDFITWAGDNILRLWDKEGRSISSFNGHNKMIYGCLEDSEGNFLSWSFDKTIKRWHRNGNLLASMEGHSEKVNGVLEIKENEFISWAHDKTIRRWNKRGECLATYSGHTDLIHGVMQLSDNRIISWADDCHIILWNETGSPEIIFSGHSSGINGILITKDNKLLSWSIDSMLKLWDLNGTLLTDFKGHSDPVYGAIETREGNILSWSKDNTVRLWNKAGHSLLVYNEHNDRIAGSLESEEGNFISWSYGWDDGTIRLWDKTGICLKKFPLEEGFFRFPEIGKMAIIADLYKVKTWFDIPYISVPVLNNPDLKKVFWHTFSGSRIRDISFDGRLIATQDNGQVCFLQLYYGNEKSGFPGMENQMLFHELS